MALRKKKVEEEAVEQTLVKIVKTGGKIEEYLFEGDEPTVDDALEAAGMEITKGQRVRMDGDLVDGDTIVEDGSVLTVTGKVAGGAN